MIRAIYILHLFINYYSVSWKYYSLHGEVAKKNFAEILSI